MDFIKSYYHLSIMAIAMLGIALSMSSCANTIPLTGGDRDLIPPQLDTVVSTPNFQIHYEKSEIFLEFDEFINFKNPAKQVVTSPPLAYPMAIKQRGKKIRINFDEQEELKEDATYLINFGESISDYTESNVLKNFAFVFSTGDYIDSLSIKGVLLDAKTKEPVEDMTIMLYDVLEDSIVFKDRPFYFAKSDENGKFEIKNLRSDTFKVTALEDLNLNYIYESEFESFGFLINPVILTDSSDIDLEIYTFRIDSEPIYLDGEVVHDGLIMLKFDQEVDLSEVQLVNKSLVHYAEREGDNVKFYVENIDALPLAFSIMKDTILDTISIRKPPVKDRKDTPVLKVSGANLEKKSGLYPTDTLVLDFSIPISKIDIGKTSLGVESDSVITSQLYKLDYDSLSPKRVVIRSVWVEGKDYVISFDSAAITDFYGRAVDSTSFEFAVGRKNSFGNIKLALKNQKADVAYVITLMKEKDVIKEWNKVDSRTEELIVNNLPPGTYSLKILEDANSNGKWDPGNYLKKIYSENIYEMTLESLKENWTLDTDIDFADLDKKKEIDLEVLDSDLLNKKE